MLSMSVFLLSTITIWFHFWQKGLIPHTRDASYFNKGLNLPDFMRFRPHTYASTQQSLRPLGPSKRYILPSAKNDVSENNFFLLHGRKIHHTKSISRTFFCQVLLCCSIYNVMGCVGIKGEAMADC